MTDQPKPPLLARIAAGAVMAVTGRTPDWFGPAAPIAPQAPPSVAGRRLDYPVSVNLQARPRVDEEITAEQLRNLAENCTVVALAIQTRKDQLTGMRGQFQLKDKTKGAKDDPRLAMLNAFWKMPDREHSWEEWIAALVDDLLVIDAATIYPRRDRTGAIYGFDFIDGATIKRIIDEWGRMPLPPDPAYQQVLHGLQAVNYTADEIIYAPRNLRTHKLYGYSPVQQVAMVVNIALRRELHTLEFYTAGTVPDMLIGTPPDWTPEQVRDSQTYFDEFLNDTAARRRATFLPAGVKDVIQTKETALKDQFDEWLARIVSYAFSLSPQWAVKDMNRATSETAQSMANAEGLAPLRQWVKRVIDRCIKAGWGWDDVEFAWFEEDATNPAEQLTVSTGYLKLGVLTVNEVRADIGRDPVEGGDVPMIFTATGAVPLSVAIAPPPPPVAPQIGHNGGPPLDGVKPNEAEGEEALLKAAAPVDRLTNVWRHFLRSAAPHVAKAIVAAMPSPLAKAAGDEPKPTPPEQDITDILSFPPNVPAAATDAAAVDAAVHGMAWPSVEATTASVLEEVAQAGVTKGLDGIAQVAGISVRDATRLANPRAIARAADQAAELIKGLTETTRWGLNELITEAKAEGWSIQQLTNRIESDFAFSEARAKMIARTEIWRATQNGAIDGWRSASAITGLKLNKRSILGMNENHCIACASAAIEGAIPMEESWSAGFAPPFHPSCYCDLVAVVDKS